MKVTFFFRVLAALIFGASTTHAASPEKKRDPSREWLDNRWEIRYVLFMDAQKYMRRSIQFAKKRNAFDGKQSEPYVYLNAKELFTQSTQVITSKTAHTATVLISFDRNGRVINNDPVLSQYTGKISLIRSLVLTRNNEPYEKPYKIANWDQGIPGDSSFSPAVCSTLDAFRYEINWKKDDPSGHVGCREWTAQLYDPGQPYIDVTTYSKRGNFIGELVGWSRFEDPPKPVIGMHGKQWLCLHECPAGERPGVIADLRAWTRKHGYPMPERPPRQPLYPDSEYQDDLNKFWNH